VGRESEQDLALAKSVVRKGGGVDRATAVAETRE